MYILLKLSFFSNFEEKLILNVIQFCFLLWFDHDSSNFLSSNFKLLFLLPFYHYRVTQFPNLNTCKNHLFYFCIAVPIGIPFTIQLRNEVNLWIFAKKQIKVWKCNSWLKSIWVKQRSWKLKCC